MKCDPGFFSSLTVGTLALVLSAGLSACSVDPMQAQPVPESMFVVSDSMENGRFDVFLPTGTGDYSVLDDGSGNLAARLRDTKLLSMSWAAKMAETWENYELDVRVKRSGAGTAAFGFRWLRSSKFPSPWSDRGYWLENAGGLWLLKREDSGVVTTLATVPDTSPVDKWYRLVIGVRTTPSGAEIEASVDSEVVLELVDPTPIPFGDVRFRTEGSGSELWLDDCKVRTQIDSRMTWSQTGGPEGGLVNSIAVDPSDWRTAYVGGGDGGVYKTTDGGGRWTEVGLPNRLWKVRVLTLELAPSDPSVVYAGVGGKHVNALWRSDNGGDSWFWTEAGEIDPEADALGIAVDPLVPTHIFVALTNTQYGTGALGLYESFDGGANLSQIYSGGKLSSVLIDPDDTSHLLAAALDAATLGSSVIASTDGGSSWGPSDSGMSGETIRQLFFYPDDPSYVFAVEESETPAVYRSTDGGASWSTMPNLASAEILRSPKGSSTLLAFRPDGLRVSMDAGSTWNLGASTSCTTIPPSGGPPSGMVGVGTDVPTAFYTSARGALWVSTDLGATCNAASSGLKVQPVAGIGVDPSDPDVVFVGTFTGLHKTTDAGETWNLLRLGQYAGIAVDPDDGDTVYIGAAEFAEVLKSTDGGTSWADVSGSITFPGVSELVIDPQDRLTIYAGTGHGPQMGQGGGGLYKSIDGGLSWTKLAGIPDVAVPAIVVSPVSSNRVVVGTMGNGVFVSDNGGASFEPRNNGMYADSTSTQIWALAMHPSDSDILYAGTNSHYAGAGNEGDTNALYKTIDAGLNWTALLAADGIPDHPIYPFLNLGAGIDAIAIDPSRPDDVFVALHDPGVIFTYNGGQDWRWINFGLIPLLTHSYPYRMEVSAGGEVLYATSCGRGVFANWLERKESWLFADGFESGDLSAWSNM